jgi:CspA family cold shock protein
MNGRIARLVVEKGFGFVRGDDDSVERFFHRSAVVGQPFELLQEGQPVVFEEEQSAKGPRARRVEVA